MKNSDETTVNPLLSSPNQIQTTNKIHYFLSDPADR